MCLYTRQPHRCAPRVTHHRSIRFVTALGLVVLFSGVARANLPPDTPVVTEPELDGQIVNPADVHMECTAFSDPDVGDTHVCSDWEIWTITPNERVWVTSCIGGVERVHTHLGDGVFENSHAGKQELFYSTDYRLRVRHRDSSGDVATEWSAWGERLFTTGDVTSVFALEQDDILESPTPTWRDTFDTDLILAPGAMPPSLSVETADGELLLLISGLDGLTNQLVNPVGLADHGDVRIVVDAGSIGADLLLPESILNFVNHEGENISIYLPAISLAPTEQAVFWVASNGSTYYGLASQTTPDFSQLAQGAPVPWTTTQPGYKVEIVATGFQLPVKIAFAPEPGPEPNDPYYYVTELYGQIKVVTRDGTISDYATGLLNFNPTGAFPGSGEQGLTGIAVDPNTGDVFAAMLYDGGGPHYPKVDRFTSLDGGLTAATRTTILDMFGESQGQSHQISNVSIGPDDHLYVHLGDGFDSSTAQNLDSFRGKILRMNLDGSAPSDNPFYNAGDGINARDYVYAYGLRNPFGGGWRATDSSLYEVENGPSQDRFAKVVSGRNYLWDGTNESMTNYAIYNWNPATAPVNIAFVQPSIFSGSNFPLGKQDHAFVTESGPTWATGPQSRGKRVSEFVLDANGDLISGPTDLVVYSGTGKATAVGLAAGPDGLYFSDLYKDLDYTTPIDRGANILRIKYIGQADFIADVTNGTAPLTVQFTDNSDVPGATEWLWDFGDGTTSALQNPSHMYTADGIYPVQLSVTGDSGLRVERKNGYIRVGSFQRIAFIGGSIPLPVPDLSIVNFLTSAGFLVDSFDDEPANHPSAAQLANSYDLVICSSTIISSNIADQFRDENVPLVYWEQALNRIDREPLSDNGVVIAGQTTITVLYNTHPVTSNLPTGTLTVFNAPANISVANGSFGPGVNVLAGASGVSGQAAIVVAETGSTLLGGHLAPARRVFLYLDDNSWLSANAHTQRILEQAVRWAMGLEVPSVPGDHDHDGDVDFSDAEAFADCMAGPDLTPDPPPPTTSGDCLEAFDFDDDLSVTAADFAAFQGVFTGPNP